MWHAPFGTTSISTRVVEAVVCALTPSTLAGCRKRRIATNGDLTLSSAELDFELSHDNNTPVGMHRHESMYLHLRVVCSN